MKKCCGRCNNDICGPDQYIPIDLKDLHDMAVEFRSKSTAMPREYLAKMIDKFTDKNEKGLMRCVESYCLLTNSGFFWRTPNKSSQVGQSAKMKKGAKTHEILSGMATERVAPVFGFSSGTNGMSDLAGFISIHNDKLKIPISIAIEIKIPGDTQKPDQIKFEAKVNKAGGWYVIIATFADFVVIVETIKEYYKQLKPLGI